MTIKLTQAQIFLALQRASSIANHGGQGTPGTGVAIAAIELANLLEQEAGFEFDRDAFLFMGANVIEHHVKH